MNAFEPILAEIADKMPTLDVVWGRSIIAGTIIALVTGAISTARLLAGGAMVAVSLALGILSASSGGMMDELIVRELGTGYLYQQRLSDFVPFALATLAWLIVRLVRRQGNGSTMVH